MSYAPIVSPYFAEQTPWPYWRGPSYVRPVFGEESRRGAFMRSPIVRMPSLTGLGIDPQTTLTNAPPPPKLTPSPTTTCSAVASAGADIYGKCITFNQNLIDTMSADPEKFKTLSAAAEAARSKCDGIENLEKWAGCFYEELVPTPWFKKTAVIGGAIIAGAVVLGAITAFARHSDG